MGQLAGSAGVGAGVVMEKGLVWVAREGPRGGGRFTGGWGGQSGRREAPSRQQLLSLGPAFKPCWPCTVFSVSPCFPSSLPLPPRK